MIIVASLVAIGLWPRILDPVNDLVRVLAALLPLIEWPIVALAGLGILGRPIAEFLLRGRKLRLRLGDYGEIELTASEAEGLLTALAKEIDTLVQELSPLQKRIIVRVRNSLGPPQVASLFDAEFRRSTDEQNSHEHEALRDLRRRHLVVPTEGSQWFSHKHAQLTPFGTLVTRLRFEMLREEGATPT
jgi:hypothetical protein